MKPFLAKFSATLAAFLTLGVPVAGLRAQEVHAPEPPPEFNPATEPTVLTVAKVMPAVVNIATERVLRRTEQDPFEQFFNQFFDDMTSNRRPHEQLQQKVTSLGSGFLIDEDGSIVTNEHVVERAADLRIKVIFSDGTVAPARYIAGDPKADLALIRVDKKGSRRQALSLHQPDQGLPQPARRDRLGPWATRSATTPASVAASSAPTNARSPSRATPTATSSRPTPPSIPATAAVHSSILAVRSSGSPQ